MRIIFSVIKYKNVNGMMLKESKYRDNENEIRKALCRVREQSIIQRHKVQKTSTCRESGLDKFSISFEK